ncbi:MAG: UDP-N-acetyl-D-mannosamine dehydrogenase, partial [Burkholderiaceae bacterium]|nr:UDP-N-acetyl-D-mannosamine dehydrogenase [Burkholderiaceae bacterium]
EVNDAKPAWVVAKVHEAVARCGRPASELTVALMGLAFKPNIDDLRESPALHIAEALTRTLPARYIVAEPNVGELPASLHDHRLVDATEAVAKADIVVFLVAHSPFAEVARAIPSNKFVIDVVGLPSAA